jgi:hypothetical protein
VGGNAIKTFFGVEPKRIENSDYWGLVNSIYGSMYLTGKVARCHATEAYSEKESHGDLDVIVALKEEYANINLQDFLNSIFDIKFIHQNSNCLSCLIQDHQIDFIFVDQVSFYAECAFRDFSPFGNIFSRLLKQLEVSWKTAGLFYIFRGGENDSYKKGIFLTDSFDKILRLGGLNPELYGRFEKESQIFDYVCSSRYFRKSIYALENLNHVNRKRDAVRPDYNRFNAYIQDKRDSSYILPEKNEMVGILCSKFPNLFGEIQKCHEEIRQESLQKHFFSGDLVAGITGLQGVELGKAMSYFDKALGVNKKTAMSKFKSQLELIEYIKVAHNAGCF